MDNRLKNFDLRFWMYTADIELEKPARKPEEISFNDHLSPKSFKSTGKKLLIESKEEMEYLFLGNPNRKKARKLWKKLDKKFFSKKKFLFSRDKKVMHNKFENIEGMNMEVSKVDLKHVYKEAGKYVKIQQNIGDEWCDYFYQIGEKLFDDNYTDYLDKNKYQEVYEKGNIFRIDDPDDKIEDSVPQLFEWKKSKTDFYEFVYAQYYSDCIEVRGKKLNKKEFVRYNEALYGMEHNANPDSTVNGSLKRNDPTPFIDRLKKSLLDFCRRKDNLD